MDVTPATMMLQAKVKHVCSVISSGVGRMLGILIDKLISIELYSASFMYSVI